MPGLFGLFSSFSHYNDTYKGKSVDGVLGIQTREHRMGGADESTVL